MSLVKFVLSYVRLGYSQQTTNVPRALGSCHWNQLIQKVWKFSTQCPYCETKAVSWGSEIHKWGPGSGARAFRYRFSCAINESPIPGTRTRPQATQSLSWPSSGLFLSSWRSKLFCDYEKKSETVGGETSKEEIATKIIPKVVLLKKAEKWPRGSFQKFRQNWKGYRITFEKTGLSGSC